MSVTIPTLKDNSLKFVNVAIRNFTHFLRRKFKTRRKINVPERDSLLICV